MVEFSDLFGGELFLHLKTQAVLVSYHHDLQTNPHIGVSLTSGRQFGDPSRTLNTVTFPACSFLFLSNRTEFFFSLMVTLKKDVYAY